MQTSIPTEPWRADVRADVRPDPTEADVLTADPPRRARAAWPFWVALGAQALLLIAIPSSKLAAWTTGQTVYLRATSIDPVDLLAGRYVALDYPVLGWAELEKLPGWATTPNGRGATVSVTLAPSAAGAAGAAWTAIAISGVHPTTLPPGQVAVRGTLGLDGLALGVDRWHVDASRGPELERVLADQKADAVAELRVDAAGTAALVGLRVNGQTY